MVMSLTQAKLKADRTKIYSMLSDLGATTTVTRNDTGATFTAARTKRLSFRQMNDAGWQSIYDFSIRCPYDSVSDLSDRSTVTFDGTEYRVLRVEHGEAQVWSLVHLGDIVGQMP